MSQARPAAPTGTPRHGRAGARGPLVLDTHELGRRPGSMRPVRTTVPAPADLGVELIRVAEGAEVTLDLRLESVMEGVLVSGTATALATGECGRCLEPVEVEVEVDVQELYAYVDSTTSETADDEEAARLDGDLLDLEPVLRDAIVLALPMTPLCSPDCPGLCTVCGERLVAGEPPHDHPVIDPRWAALARFGHNESNGADGADDEAPARPVRDEREK